METLSRSWDLLGQSFAILKSDKELMWLPVLSAMFCLAATAIILGIGLIVVMPPGPFPHDAAQQKLLGKAMAPFIFLFYFVIYSLGIYFNVALVSIASNRLGGGHATLNDGLQVSWKRKWSILQWALLAATVGMLLQMLERRLSVLGRILTRITGFVSPLRTWARSRRSTNRSRYFARRGARKLPAASASDLSFFFSPCRDCFYR